jgi:hypothetical protein
MPCRMTCLTDDSRLRLEKPIKSPTLHKDE